MTIHEKWAPVPIPEVSDLYDISNYGRVRAPKARQWRLADSILRPTAARSGHLRVSLRCQQRGVDKLVGVHRLVALAFIPNPLDKPHVNHIDGNPANNHVGNLEWVTPAENAAHAARLGLVARGERHGVTTLTESDVTSIREAALSRTHTDIANERGMSRHAIWCIVNARTWKHVPFPADYEQRRQKAILERRRAACIARSAK